MDDLDDQHKRLVMSFPGYTCTSRKVGSYMNAERMKYTPAGSELRWVTALRPMELVGRMMHWSTVGLENMLNILLVRYCDKILYSSLKEEFNKEEETVIKVEIT